MTLTTILQVYKRPQYLAEQLEAIKKQTVKSDKIIIIHNEGNTSFKYPKDVEIIYANPNRKFHLRFAIGLLEISDYLAFYDDDTIPGSRWIENCIKTIEKHDCICVTNGRIIDRQHKLQYAPGWNNPSDNEHLVDFGGHSWVLRTKNLKYMWYDNSLNLNNGEDIQLSANAQIFGKIPTYVPPHPIFDKTLWGTDPKKAMKYGNDSVASWIVNPIHNEERFKLFDEYVKRGWKLLLEK